MAVKRSIHATLQCSLVCQRPHLPRTGGSQALWLESHATFATVISRTMARRKAFAARYKRYATMAKHASTNGHNEMLRWF